MKQPSTSIVSKLFIGMMIAFGSVFATGCAKDDKNDTALPGEGTRVVVSVRGIDEGKSSSLSKLKGAAGAVSTSKSGGAGLIESSAFDVLVTRPESMASNVGAKPKIRAATSSSVGLKAETPMPDGFSYRVFLRKQGATTLESVALTSGTAGVIPVDKGAIYEWFAVSYNSTTAVPDANGNDVELTDLTNLLYTKGEFEVADTEGDVVVPLAIVFKPRVTRAVVEINTMGMFAPITSAAVSVTGLYAAPEAIDVVTGDLIGGDQSQEIAFSEFIPVPNSDGQRVATTAYLGGNSDEDIAISVTNLEITLDNGEARNFGTATLTQAFAPEAGMEQTIVLNFIESPLTHNSVKWSRSNLYYRTDVMPSNPYRFNHVNEYSDTVDPNSFFAFRGHLPRKLASAVETEQKDPCALVYPAGLWKTPNHMETSVVTSRSGKLVDFLAYVGMPSNEGGTQGAAIGADYIEFTPPGAGAGVNPVYGSATSGNNKLRFNYNGIQTNVDITDEAIALDLAESKGTLSAFWTNQQGTGYWGVPGIAYVNFLGFTHQSLSGSDVAAGTAGASPLVIDDLGLNVLVSELMNVRCIRNPSWNTVSASPTYNPYPDLSGL